MDYIKDFGNTPAERSENLLNRLHILKKPLPKSLLTMEGSYFRNLTQRDNDSTFQYLPFVSFFTEYLPIMKKKFYTDVFAGLTNFKGTGLNYTRVSLNQDLGCFVMEGNQLPDKRYRFMKRPMRFQNPTMSAIRQKPVRLQRLKAMQMFSF
jgi:hypothetical protein